MERQITSYIHWPNKNFYRHVSRYYENSRIPVVVAEPNNFNTMIESRRSKFENERLQRERWRTKLVLLRFTSVPRTEVDTNKYLKIRFCPIFKNSPYQLMLKITDIDTKLAVTDSCCYKSVCSRGENSKQRLAPIRNEGGLHISH